MAFSVCWLLSFTLAASFQSISSSQDSMNETSYSNKARNSMLTSTATSVTGSQSTPVTLTSSSLFSLSVSESTQELSTLSSSNSTTMPQLLSTGQTTGNFSSSPSLSISASTQESSTLSSGNSTTMPQLLSTGQTTGNFSSSPSSTSQTESASSPNTTVMPQNHSSQATEMPSKTSASLPVSTGQPTTVNSTATPLVQNKDTKLTFQEKIITGFTSIVLGLILLALLLYMLLSCSKRRAQFTHQPLYDDLVDTEGDGFAVPDDTLVISGGLYDGPQVFSPPKERSGYQEFPFQPPHFQLEFFREEEQFPAHRPEGSAMETFHPASEDNA